MNKLFLLKPLFDLLVGASPIGWIVGPDLLFKLLRQIRIAATHQTRTCNVLITP